MAPEKEDLLPAEADDLSELLQTVSSPEAAGWLQVYAPGSIMCRPNVQGSLMEIEVLEPELNAVEQGPLS